MPTARAGLVGSLIVIAAATLFGALGVTSRFAYDAGLEPFAFVTWRAGVGALGIVLVVAATRRPGRGWASLGSAAPNARRALLLTVFLAAGVNLSMFLSFERTTIALALLGFYTYPAMVAAASSLLGRERLDLQRLVALALALVGMAAVVLGGLGSGSAVRLDALGIALGLAAAAFQTMFVLTSRGYSGVPADVAMGAILAGSALIGAVVSVATGGITSLTMPLGDPSLLVLLIGVGLFAAALPSTMFLVGIRRIGAVRTGILMLFEPVVGVALAALLLAEGLAPLQVLGGATILLAALLVQRGSAGREEIPAVVPVPGGP
jgi:drug/metabolite transporter (DMT)-like permease